MLAPISRGSTGGSEVETSTASSKVAATSIVAPVSYMGAETGEPVYDRPVMCGASATASPRILTRQAIMLNEPRDCPRLSTFHARSMMLQPGALPASSPDPSCSLHEKVPPAGTTTTWYVVLGSRIVPYGAVKSLIPGPKVSGLLNDNSSVDGTLCVGVDASVDE